MVDKAGYLARVGQAIETHGELDDHSWVSAGYIAEDALDHDQATRFDDGDDEHLPSTGNMRSHRKGKLAEYTVLVEFERQGIWHIDRCLIPIKCRAGRPEHVDFYAYVQGRWASVDVKSGTLGRGETYEDKLDRLDAFGLPVNAKQCNDRLSDLVFYVLFDYRLQRGALIGYATRSQVLDQRRPVLYPPRVKSPCKIIPITSLHPVEELLGPGGIVEEQLREYVKA